MNPQPPGPQGIDRRREQFLEVIVRDKSLGTEKKKAGQLVAATPVPHDEDLAVRKFQSQGLKVL
jgi:hypothetical protein